MKRKRNKIGEILTFSDFEIAVRRLVRMDRERGLLKAKEKSDRRSDRRFWKLVAKNVRARLYEATLKKEDAEELALRDQNALRDLLRPVPGF